VGLRRIDDRTSSWIARYRAPKEPGAKDTVQEYKALGLLRPDFDYDQAVVEAEKWFREKEAGDTAVSTVTTVSDACRAYVAALREDKDEPRPGTARDAEARFERTVFDKPLVVDGKPLGDIKLTKIKTKNLEDWRAALELSKASKNRTLTAVKAALNLAAKNDKHALAAMALEVKGIVPFEKAGKRRELYLDLRQRRALLKAAAGPLRDLIEAAMLTGARAGELTSATVADFDARQRTLKLSGKTGERTVSVQSDAALTLFKRLAKGRAATSYLLVRADGGQWKHSDWDELVREAATKAKLPAGVCLYTLRHSYITAALAARNTTLDVARQVGTSLVMIDRHYGQRSEGAADRLAKVVMV